MNRRQQVLSWWQGRERREQWMLAVMGACLLAFVYWYALMLPLRALRDEALAGRQRAGADLALVQARLQAMQATPPRQAEPPTAEQLPARLASTAASAGIELAAPCIPVVNNVDVAIESDPARIRDALVPGGLFVGSTPDPEVWVEDLAPVALADLPQWHSSAALVDRHIRLYSPDEVTGLLKAAGFRGITQRRNGGPRYHWEATAS